MSASGTMAADGDDTAAGGGPQRPAPGDEPGVAGANNTAPGAADAEHRLAELERALACERRLRQNAEAEVQHLKEQSVRMQQQLEFEEEALTNKLNKRLMGLKLEKEKLVQDIEREEEYLTNTLQQRMEQLKREKVDMENALEAEQEAIVNKLQRQVDKLVREKAALERQLSKHARSSLDRQATTPSDSESEREMLLRRRSLAEEGGVAERPAPGSARRLFESMASARAQRWAGRQRDSPGRPPPPPPPSSATSSAAASQSSTPQRE